VTHTRQLPRSVRWRVHVMRASLAIERVWSALWPAIGYFGLVLIASLYDLWRFVPGPVHAALLFALIAAALWSLYRRLGRITWPDLNDALHRLEVDNGLTHRPLTAYADELAVGAHDEASIRLWASYRAMLRRQFEGLRLSPPRSDLARRDPRALRFLVLIIFGAGWVLAGPQALSLIGAGFTPDLSSEAARTARVDAWVTPPDYTGHAPLFLSDDQGLIAHSGGVTVPAASELTIRITGSENEPIVSGALSEGLVEEIAPGTWGITGRIDQDGDVSINSPPHENIAWTFEVIPDIAPEIAFAPDPYATPQGLMALPYVVQDDYGVTSIDARLTLVPVRGDDGTFADGFFNADGAPRGDALFPADEPSITELALPGNTPTSAEDSPTVDWREHPWAGRDVMIQLAATDNHEGIGFSRPHAVVLPARDFLNPLAAAVAEQRQTLVQRDEAALDVALTLDALTNRPDLFIEDTTAYLAMRTAVWRLADDPSTDDMRDTYDLLWDVALRLEDGDLSLALDRIRELEQALLDALSRGADNAEIAELLAQLREAISEYLQALQQQEAQPSTADASEMMNTEDLGSLLDRIEEMAMTGSLQSAREMLQGLSDLLAQLENAAPMQSGEGMSAQEQALADALEGLSGILGGQRQLLDETFRGAQGEEGGPYARDDPWEDWGGWPPPEEWPYNQQIPEDGPAAPDGSAPRTPQELARDQQRILDALRGILDQLQEEAVEMPGTMGEAQQGMESSEDQLAGGSMSDAVPSQEQAVEALRNALDSLSEQLLSQMAERMGGQQQGRSSGQDPLGRTSPQSGPDFGDSVDVPTEREMQRARDILEELRRRAGERNRPEIELDYLERLLRRF